MSFHNHLGVPPGAQYWQGEILVYHWSVEIILHGYESQDHFKLSLRPPTNVLGSTVTRKIISQQILEPTLHSNSITATEFLLEQVGWENCIPRNRIIVQSRYSPHRPMSCHDLAFSCSKRSVGVHWNCRRGRKCKKMGILSEIGLTYSDRCTSRPTEK